MVIDALPLGKKIFFASDFHLGVPHYEGSLEREKKIVRWLESIREEAHSIYLVGDIFDFWFEYKHVIPKGFVRLQGKIAELTDSGIPVYFFTGNHDMWMFGYFEKELGVTTYRHPIQIAVGDKKLFVGHGDGLGPGDTMYKLLKKLLFSNKVCQWIFARLHPNFGMKMAGFWSRRSRLSNNKKDGSSMGEKEWLLLYCKEVEKKEHFDFYIFGHRHLPLNVEVSNNSRYINLAEWVNYSYYAVFDGQNMEYKEFEI